MTTKRTDASPNTSKSEPTPPRPFKLIGDLINNSFARARRAWANQDLKGYQHLATLQANLGANFLDLNIDGTQKLRVKLEEMLDFIPDVIPAIQEATSTPLAFDNPSILFQRRCFEVYDPSRSGRPIFNSIAASRENLDEMIEIIAEYKPYVITMVSEKFDGHRSAQCFTPEDAHGAAKDFAEMLSTKAGCTNDQIIFDPGLAPVSADTYGLVNTGLDAMRLIRNDPDLAGAHISVGLTNFSFGVPMQIREGLENAYITLAVEAGLDFLLATPEKNLHLLDPTDQSLQVVTEALAEGRPQEGETQEDAGFRQSAKIMDLY